MTASFPPPPSDQVDWENVGFKVREVNGHIESSYSVKTGKWTEPAFVQDPFLRLHGMAPALNYGQQCYEGQKAFRTPSGQITIFRPSMNATRMQHSASYISIPDVPVPHFLRCVHLAVGLNAEFVPPHETGSAMYIRPLLFGSSAQLGLQPPEEYTFCVYVMPTGVYHGSHPVDALILEDFDRAAPNGTGSAKVGGNYAPVLRHSDKARTQGYGITLHLDSATRSEIDEFSTSGFIGVKKSSPSPTSSSPSNSTSNGTSNGTSGQPQDFSAYTLVVPDSKAIIASVTSASICELATSLGMTVDKRPIPYSELSSFTEVMAAGTAAALVPIKSITMRSRDDKFNYLSGDEPGPVCKRLLQLLQGIQRGLVADEFGWCEVVRKPDVDGVERRGVSGAGKGQAEDGDAGDVNAINGAL